MSINPRNGWSDISIYPFYKKNRKEFIEQAENAVEFSKKNGNKGPSSNIYKLKELYKNKDRLYYENKDLLDRVIETFDSQLKDIDMGGSFKRVKLKITDDKRGIFDFGIASKGLYRATEFFSQELANESPNEFPGQLSGIVPADFVNKYEIGDEIQFWYKSLHTDKDYLLKQQQQGTRAIELKEEDAKLIFKTTTKKSYLMSEKKGGKAKMVEFWTPIHGDIYLVHLMPVLLAAKYLQSRGIQTRISVIRMVFGSTSYIPNSLYKDGDPYGNFTMFGYTVKEYGSEIDFNEIALNGVDDAWWQLVKDTLNATVLEYFIQKAKEQGLVDSRGKVDSKDWEVDISGSQAGNKGDYAEAFTRYKNWLLNEIKEGRAEQLRVDKKLVLFSGQYDTPGYNVEYKDVQYAIMKEVYYILDKVDFQFGKVNEVIDRIYKREVDEAYNKFILEYKANNPTKSMSDVLKDTQNKRKQYVADFKLYVEDMLIDTYYIPKDGDYPTDAKEAEEMEKELDEKLDKLYTYIASL